MRIVLGITDISSFGQCILLGNFWKPQEKYNSEQLHRMFYNKGVLRNFSKLTKGTFNEIFFIMFQAWACNFDKKGLLSHYYMRFFCTQRWYQIHMQSKKGLCVALHNLVPFVQFKKREKQPWRSVTFSKAAGWKPATLLEITLFHECFLSFLNCTNSTKSSNATHLMTTVKVNYRKRKLFDIIPLLLGVKGP